MPKKQTVFYHYTSIDALYSIVSSKTFWLANAKSSNDKTERSFKLKKFCKMLSDVKAKFADPSVIKAIDIFLEKKELVPEFEKRKFYILSLTNQKDNLAHWERYASEKHGIALALNSKLFDMLDDKLPSLFRQDILSDFDLIYSYDKCVSLIIEHINKVLNDNNFLKKEYLADVFSNCFVSLFYEISSCIKNSSFQDEYERRVVLDANEMEKRTNSLKNSICMGDKYAIKLIKYQYSDLLEYSNLEKTYFAPIRGEIRSLHHLNLSKIWDSDLIPEIMLGPNCPQSKDELRTFLDANGLQGTKITESKIPIR